MDELHCINEAFIVPYFTCGQMNVVSSDEACYSLWGMDQCFTQAKQAHLFNMKLEFMEKTWSCIVFIFTPETLILISALPCLQLCGVKPSCLLLAWSSTITSQTLFFFLEKAVKYVPLIAILYLLQDFAWKYLSPYLAVLILVTTTNNGRNDL